MNRPDRIQLSTTSAPVSAPRSRRLHLILILAVISVPASACREAIVAAQDALRDRFALDDRSTLRYGGEVMRLLNSPGK